MVDRTVSRPRPRLRRPGAWPSLGHIVFLVVATLTAINLASARYQVDGGSMRPNFDEDQILLASRLHYLLGEPQRYDVAIFHHPITGADDFIKRIIGLPGERVEIRNTQVLINGVALEEAYILEPCTALRCRNDQWELGPDEYFLLGDNRNQSTDSRVFGPVARHDLVGKVVLRYWPPATWGSADPLGFGPGL